MQPSIYPLPDIERPGVVRFPSNSAISIAIVSSGSAIVGAAEIRYTVPVEVK